MKVLWLSSLKLNIPGSTGIDWLWHWNS